MKYKTYVQKTPRVKAFLDEMTNLYHVKSEHGESDVPKSIFESGWEEDTSGEQNKTNSGN